MMTRLIAITAAFLFLGCTTMTTETTANRSISAAQCPVDPDYAPLFNVVKNDPQEIVVELGNFASFFKLSGKIKYKVMYRGSKLSKGPAEEFVTEGEFSSDKTSVRIPDKASKTFTVKKTGVYYFTVFQKESSPIWKQKVFSVAPITPLFAGHKPVILTEDEKVELAKKYAPVVSYHDQELYFPVSLPYLMNQVEPDPQLKTEPFLLTNKRVKELFSSKPTLNIPFNFEQMPNILPYYGHAESVLKSGLKTDSDTRLKTRYGKNHITVYYSIFEYPNESEIYINYHFFYTYDPKNGTKDKNALPAHIFDRESMTVVVKSTSRSPLRVVYGAHLPSQIMGFKDGKGKPVQKWDTGRVYLNWRDVELNQGRPMPAVALGSHGIYPLKGNYAVYVNNSPNTPATLLDEPAGGDKMLYPDFMTDFAKTPTSHPYKLEDLKLESLTSDCANANNILAFSGSTVDVLGPVNATFPPYTDREEDFATYADVNGPMFEMAKAKAASH